MENMKEESKEKEMQNEDELSNSNSGKILDSNYMFNIQSSLVEDFTHPRSNDLIPLLREIQDFQKVQTKKKAKKWFILGAIATFILVVSFVVWLIVKPF